MKKYFSLILISVLVLFGLLCFVVAMVRKESYTPSSEVSVANVKSQKIDCTNLELYECPDNSPHQVGASIVKDVDSDGRIEHITRYDMLLGDRVIQGLYIVHRNLEGADDVVKFLGDPYGFARFTEPNSIVVGRFLTRVNSPKSWDDFDRFEIKKYEWTKAGAREVSTDIIKASSVHDLSASIQELFK